MTFGHKHGVPQNTFKNFDLQVLPNPKTRCCLRKGITGLDKDFQEVFWSFDDVLQWYSKFVEKLQALIHSIEDDERVFSEVRIGLGCHSGQHRSGKLHCSLSNIECTFRHFGLYKLRYFNDTSEVAIAERLARESWTLKRQKYTRIITKTEHNDIFKKKSRKKPQISETNS